MKNKKWLPGLLLILIGCSQPSKSENAGGSAGVHYYETGKLKDSTHILEPGYERQLDYYEAGEVKQNGILFKGNMQGAWRTYDRQGKITIQYYDNGQLVPKNTDPDDFYFEECKVDSSFSLNLPSKWQINVYPGIDVIRNKFWHPDSGYIARIAIIKYPVSAIHGSNQTEIADFFIRSIDSVCGGAYHKITNVRWPKPNVLVVMGLVKLDGKLIGFHNVYYLGEENYYYINSTAYSGPHWEFTKYLDVFMEGMYSIKWKGKEVF